MNNIVKYQNNRTIERRNILKCQFKLKLIFDCISYLRSRFRKKITETDVEGVVIHYKSESKAESLLGRSFSGLICCI